jgi:hypothetical protein
VVVDTFFAAVAIGETVDGLLAAAPGVKLGLTLVPETLLPSDPAVRAVVIEVAERAVVVEPAVLAIGALTVGAGDRVPSTDAFVVRVTGAFVGVATAVRVVFTPVGVGRPSAVAFTGVRGVVVVAGFVPTDFVIGFLAATDEVAAWPGAIPRDARVDVLLGFSDID